MNNVVYAVHDTRRKVIDVRVAFPNYTKQITKIKFAGSKRSGNLFSDDLRTISLNDSDRGQSFSLFPKRVTFHSRRLKWKSRRYKKQRGNEISIVFADFYRRANRSRRLGDLELIHTID